MTRLMSPGDLGGLVKPFVFLDYFEFRGFKSDRWFFAKANFASGADESVRCLAARSY